MIFFSIFGNPLFSPSVTKGKKDKILAEVVKLILAGKFGAFSASIPLPIFAAIYCILFGIVGESELPFWASYIWVCYISL
jgi:nucleobase transporter 1/2